MESWSEYRLFFTPALVFVLFCDKRDMTCTGRRESSVMKMYTVTENRRGRAAAAAGMSQSPVL